MVAELWPSALTGPLLVHSSLCAFDFYQGVEASAADHSGVSQL